jgi:transcriptional regulator with XRE-family HTH domain
MTAESPESFATLLRHFRQAAGLTQDELADRSRVSARTISDLERGLNAPRKTTLVLLADALQLAGADRRRLSAAARGESGDVAPSASSSAALPIYLTRLIGRDADTPTARHGLPLAWRRTSPMYFQTAYRSFPWLRCRSGGSSPTASRRCSAFRKSQDNHCGISSRWRWQPRPPCSFWIIWSTC